MPSGDEARTWSVNWNLATDTATLAYTETAPEPWFPFTGNALGLLSTRFDEPGWLWVPWTGEPKTFPDQVYTSAWNYVALDPDYLYNVVSGRFHTLRADLPAEAGPDPLVPGSLWGEYHVVGR